MTIDVSIEEIESFGVWEFVMDDGDGQFHGAITVRLHFERCLGRVEVREVGAMRGKKDVVHRIELEHRAGLISDAQYMRW